MREVRERSSVMRRDVLTDADDSGRDALASTRPSLKAAASDDRSNALFTLHSPAACLACLLALSERFWSDSRRVQNLGTGP